MGGALEGSAIFQDSADDPLSDLLLQSFREISDSLDSFFSPCPFSPDHWLPVHRNQISWIASFASSAHRHPSLTQIL